VAGQLPQGSFRGAVEAAFSGSDWRAALARGGVFEQTPRRSGAVQAGVSRLRFEEPALVGDGSHVLLANPSPLLFDGRGAALPWLQETPDPVSKISWQSWLEISRSTAEGLGVERGDVVSVETAAGRAEVPVLPRGGIRDDVAALAIGQGHRVGHWASRSGDGRPGEARGVSAISLLPSRTDESGGRAWLVAKARLANAGRHERLALAQHTDNKRGRQLGDAVALSALAGDAGHGAPAGGHGEGHAGEHGAAAHGEEPHEIRRPYDPGDDAVGESAYRWGMTVDLDRCTGCSACVVACSIENNVPNVGEEGAIRARLMQWIRIER
jgi:molybdopterin-containing oxidoreductase family iron-sulfur binding subunit